MNEVLYEGGISRGGNGADDPLESMKQFMHPGGLPAIVPPNSDPVNTNPDIMAGNPSAEKFGMGRGPNGAN